MSRIGNGIVFHSPTSVRFMHRFVHNSQYHKASAVRTFPNFKPHSMLQKIVFSIIVAEYRLFPNIFFDPIASICIQICFTIDLRIFIN